MFVEHHASYQVRNWLNSQIYGIIDKTSKRCKAVTRGLITTNQVCILYFDVWNKRISEGDHAQNCLYRIMRDIRWKFDDIPRYMVLWTQLKNAVKQWPEGQLLLAKYGSCNLMYELKEYLKEIMPKIGCIESCVIIGENLTKFPDIWYYGQNSKML